MPPKVRIMGKIISSTQSPTIRELLSKGTFIVPLYQRPYSWGSQEITDLFSDLNEAVKSNMDQYFLGSMVFHERDNQKYNVVDGHQRIATITILLATLRDKFKERKLDDRGVGLISGLIIRNRINGVGEPVFESPLHTLEADYIEQLQKGVTPQSPRSRSRGRPRKNKAEIAHKHFKEKISKMSDDEIKKFTDFLLEKTVIIEIVVNKDEEPFTVFEVLNARGLDLSVADLVKNDLLRRTKKDKRERMNSIWTDIENNLKKENIDFSRFLRHYWLSKYAVVTKTALYHEITTYLKKQVDPFIFAKDIDEHSKIYTDLLYPTPKDKNILELIDLREMKLMQHLSLLLAAKKCDSKFFDKLISICATITLRYLVVGDRNPNELEGKYSEWAKKIRDKPNDTKVLDAIISEAKKMCLDDSTFEKNFEELGKNDDIGTNTARHILRKIEEHKKKSSELKVSYNDIDVEHIMPINPKKGSWPNWNKSQIQLLGNLTLIGTEYNRRAKNYSFDKKKKEYKKSKISITKKLTKTSTWEPKDIETRQKYFASLAPKLWSF